MGSVAIVLPIVANVLQVGQPVVNSSRGEEPPAAESVADAWWFPSEIPAGTTLRYHLTYEVVAYSAEAVVGRGRQEQDFALAISRQEGKPGYIVQIPPRKAGAGAERKEDLSLMVGYLRSINQEGIQVTESDVLVRQEPLLRGPWRKGDRLTLAAGLSWLISISSLVCHAEVVSADSKQAHLTAQLWGGHPMPEWQGKGELWVESDVQGVGCLRMKWNEKRQARTVKRNISITRSEVLPPTPTTQPSDQTQR